MHCFGFVLLHTSAWCICCARPTGRRRRNVRNQANNGNAAAGDQRNQNEPGVEPVDRLGDLLLNRNTDFFPSLRLAFEQICFNVTAADEGVDEAVANISERCFDFGNFQNNVLAPLLAVLVCSILAPLVISKAMIWTLVSTKLEQTISQLGFIALSSTILVMKSKAQVSEWFSKIHDSIRNERYLIGQELENMER